MSKFERAERLTLIFSLAGLLVSLIFIYTALANSA
jgi:hypothetical protein